MPRYVLAFEKRGMMKYLSHLDLLRLFKRAFRSAEVDLLYTEGFNPHPKIAFGQPLSLGYESLEEWLEIETETEQDSEIFLPRIHQYLPEGIKIISVELQEPWKKTIASSCVEAHYQITFPIGPCELNCKKLATSFLAQKEILVEKSSKKHREVQIVDIKPMIRFFALKTEEEFLLLDTVLDAGSVSNLSPELLIQGFLRFSQLQIPRHNVKVIRTKLVFQNN